MARLPSGRQLDGTDGTIEILAECVEAAAGRCDVYMDGGIRRGKDVYKALALGAKVCLLCVYMACCLHPLYLLFGLPPSSLFARRIA